MARAKSKSTPKKSPPQKSPKRKKPTKKQEKPIDPTETLKNSKHEDFCNQYVIDSNGQQAATRAGYSPKTARVTAAKLLTKGNIAARLAYLQALKNSRARKTADDIERELEKLAFSDITNVVTWSPDTGMTYVKGSDEMDPEHTAAIESIEVTEKALGKESDESMVLKTKVKQYPKLKALELLGKQKGMFGDKLDISGDVTVEIVNYAGDSGKEKG